MLFLQSLLSKLILIPTRHDFRHSLHTLYGLYEAGDYETLGAYGYTPFVIVDGDVFTSLLEGNTL